jgi:hypothetical protein
MRRFRSASVAGVIVITFLATAVRADDQFEPPKEGVFTEKQFNAYCEVTKEWLSTSQAAAKAMEGSKSGLGALSVMAKTDQRFKDSLAKHGMSDSEYSWVAGQVWEAYTVTVMVDTLGKQAAEELQNQTKKTDDDLAQQQKKLAELEAAQKAGGACSRRRNASGACSRRRTRRSRRWRK